MAKDVDILTRFATANDEAVGYINRVDDATAKFRKGPRKGSIVKAAQGNLFEFPVFISNTIPLDYATATTSLLEQIYASYLQMAMSINPIIDAEDSARGVQFANYKTNTNKYLEYTDTSYQHDVCHAEYINEEVKMEFDLLSIDDKEAKLINEAYDYQPLSEFDHYFQEAPIPVSMTDTRLYPIPQDSTIQYLDPNDPSQGSFNPISDPDNLQFATVPEIRQILEEDRGYRPATIDQLIDGLQNTCSVYELPNMTIYDTNKRVNAADKTIMDNIGKICSMQTPKEFYSNHRYDDVRNSIAALDQKYPGFKAAMELTMRDVENARAKAANTAAQTNLFNKQAANFDASARKTNTDIGDIAGAPSYKDTVAAQRNKAKWDADTAESNAAVARRNAEKATSNYYKAMDAIKTGSDAIGAVAGALSTGANAAVNLATIPSQIRGRKADADIKSWQASHMDEANARQWTDTYARTKTSGIQYVDDSKCAKMNTMKPLLMKVTLNRLNKNDSLQPIEYIVGVKCHSRMVQASILPEVAKYPLKEMDKISRKVKWRAGELKFFKDLVFRIKEKKQTAADSRDPNRKWYRRLYELAHMKGDAPAAAVVEGKSLFKTFIKDKQGKGKLLNGMIPNASIIMSQADVDNIKAQTDIDLLKPSAAKKFCGELFLISLIIIDTDRESIKILLPDINSDYDVHSLAAVNKQLAQLDTMGSKTRDMFKLLGN